MHEAPQQQQQQQQQQLCPSVTQAASWRNNIREDSSLLQARLNDLTAEGH